MGDQFVYRRARNVVAVIAALLLWQGPAVAYDYGTFYLGCSPVNNLLRINLAEGETPWTPPTSAEAMGGALEWEGVRDHTGDLVVDVRFSSTDYEWNMALVPLEGRRGEADCTSRTIYIRETLEGDASRCCQARGRPRPWLRARGRA